MVSLVGVCLIVSPSPWAYSPVCLIGNKGSCLPIGRGEVAVYFFISLDIHTSMQAPMKAVISCPKIPGTATI